MGHGGRRSTHIMLQSLDCLSLFDMFIALIVVIIGILATIKFKWGSELVGMPIPALLILMGAINMVGFAIGLHGLHTKSWKMMTAFGVFQLVLILAEVFLLLLSVLYEDNFTEWVLQSWEDSSDEAKNTVQAELNCCGFESRYESPGSVCPETATEGCLTVMKREIHEAFLWVFAVAAILLTFQILAFVFTVVVTLRMPVAGEDNKDSAFDSMSSDDEFLRTQRKWRGRRKRKAHHGRKDGGGGAGARRHRHNRNTAVAPV